MNKELHWYNLCYIGTDLESGLQSYSAGYCGVVKKRLTRKDIVENKKVSGVSEDSVLISASYLGKMTKDELMGEDNE